MFGASPVAGAWRPDQSLVLGLPDMARMANIAVCSPGMLGLRLPQQWHLSISYRKRIGTEKLPSRRGEELGRASFYGPDGH